ncbi:MAG: Glucosyl-3-phosphoglycerate synthase [Spirochaetes bacterium ADurb.Bin218]|jgi:hypothetical protein|nr:hypothetical protein [Spirochaetota bacterium]OQA97340.1 MAG: Glucosyl-3-phosphoglycerate synthase [Spirochaetes bacterium ADurb.Bin218]HOQ11696.1 hypothetical protein [Spirochaetota bacterium]HOV08633.1 hypothetical protein [Spirochaetota bacterium]HPX90184.1 hypothetical protein [Spirochaetota bacterium]
MELTKYHYSDFDAEKILKIKKDKKIFVVFSTFGEREASLVKEKIELLMTLPKGLIDKIFLNHRRITPHPDKTEIMAKDKAPLVEVIVANEVSVPDMKDERGKGSDMRRTLYEINHREQNINPSDIIIVFLDADVVPEYFGTHFVTALAGALLEGNDFSKASFWREMGRVKKFVAQPLFSVIDHPLINSLREFAYPLSGECAATLDFFNKVSFWQIYGVETGILTELSLSNYKAADVNLGLYDHEHHPDINIQKMCFGIIRTYLKSLIDAGIISLCDEAKISNLLQFEYIDSDGARVRVEESLTELKYRPLKEIL